MAARKKVDTVVALPTIKMPYMFEPRDYQIEAYRSLDNGVRRQLWRWSRRTGKDLTAINYMFREMLVRVGNYYYILPEYSQGRKAIFEGKDSTTGRAYIDYMPKEYIKGNINKNEMKFETVNGSLFRVVGGDNYNTSIVGTGFVGCVISEFALQDPELLDYLRPILNESKAWLIINSTPRGQNHMYKLEEAVRNNPEWNVSVIQTMWPDRENYRAGITTQEQINSDISEGMSIEKVEQEYGVSYTAGVHGAYYADQIKIARTTGRIGKFPHNDHQYVDTFWDIGVNDDTVIWFKQSDGRGNIFIDYYEANNRSIAEHVSVLRDKGYHYRTHYLPHDGAERSKQTKIRYKDLLFDTLVQAGISSDIMLAERPTDKQVAIDTVRSRFSSYYFNEATCQDGITKLSLYHKKYDRNKQCFTDNPVHDWTSHCADAMTTEALTAHLQEDFLFGSKEIKIITDFNPLD